MNARHTPSLESLLERHREGGAFPTYAELSALAAPAASSEQAEPILTAPTGWAVTCLDNDDGQTWLSLMTPLGAVGSFQCRTNTGNGPTIASQVAHYFKDAMNEAKNRAAAAPAAPLPDQPEPLSDLWMHEDMADDETKAVVGLKRKDLQAAYIGARKDLSYWTRRALEAEEKLHSLAGAAPLPELTGPSDALTALLTKIDDAFENYERFGEVCRFEGNSMIYAATLEEIVALRGAYHVASSTASPSPAPAPTEQQQTLPLEQAPPNSLPNWDECALRVENSDFIAKRMAEGGHGPEADSKLATQLHRFIFEYDDADSFRSAWFMHRLELTIEEAKRMGGVKSKESAESEQPSTENKR